jgi:hypothetical protein
VYFVAGDRERLNALRDAQPTRLHRDERFMLDAPSPIWQPHRSLTAGPSMNKVLSGIADSAGRRWPLFFKPLGGVDMPNARAFGQGSVVDLGIHEVAAWWLALALGQPWQGLVAPAVWFDPPAGTDIRESGPVILGMGGVAELPQPGTGFDQMISDAAFFDALIGSQDRHDQNLRAELPPRLGLIDHGYAFARPGDLHSPFSTAGFFLRLRYGERRFPLSPAPALNYNGVGPLSPQLAEHEVLALRALEIDSSSLLGVAALLEGDRADALRQRVDQMLRADSVLPVGAF